MQNELAAATNGDLHDEKQAREAWDNFLVKLFRKVEIEGGRSKLDEIRKQQQEEETIYTDEVGGKYIVHNACECLRAVVSKQSKRSPKFWMIDNACATSMYQALAPQSPQPA